MIPLTRTRSAVRGAFWPKRGHGCVRQLSRQVQKREDETGGRDPRGRPLSGTRRMTGQERDRMDLLEQVQISEARLRRVIDTIPTMAWCNLPDGSNEFVNRRWLEYTGLSAEESHGSGWQVAIHPDDV